MSAAVIGAGAETTLLNAFTYLAEQEAVGDHQAEDVLFLTYNADLGFLEARLLGLCQATGARVTVVADGRVWAPDLRAIRHAGRSYHVGLVDTAAAFHPKLMVLVGPQRALATVGSGNLTLGGWQYNSELLTVFTGNTETMPKAFEDIRNVLRTLTQATKLDPLTTEAIGRITARLDTLLADADLVDTGHRVASSWDGPLISLLPTEPVAELLLYAPFHDPASQALRKVLSRTTPSTVRLAVQSGWTHLDSGALSRVINDYATQTKATVQVVEDAAGKDGDKPRYRHGKLIEWVTHSGQRSALTGSPNLSLAALDRTVEPTGSGGNYEIAVVGPVEESLFPNGANIDPTTITTVAIQDDPEPADESAPTEPRLVAAARTETGIRILLGRACDADVTVEVSHRSNPPEQWEVIATLAANATDGEFPTDVAAGSRVRLTWTHSVNGLRYSTTPVFISDPNNLRRRPLPTSSTSRTQQASPLDIFSDDQGWLTALHNDLADFSRDIASTQGPKPSRVPGAAGTDDDASDAGGHAAQAGADPWLWLQDDTARKFGPGLAAFALALPALPAGDGAAVRWADKTVIETEIGLEGDTTEAIENDDSREDLPPSPDPDKSAAEVIDHDDASDRLKAARRRWAVNATKLAPNLTLPSRMLVVRITLTFWTAGNWKPEDPEPETLAIQLLNTLNVTGTSPELGSRVAALTAITLTLLREQVNLTVRDDRLRRYKATEKQFAHLLHDRADEALLADYVSGMRNKNHGPLDPDAVAGLIATVLAEDPLGEVQSDLEYRGYRVTRPQPHLLHVQGTIPVPFLFALNTLGSIEEQTGIGVWAQADSGDWALSVWNDTDLVTVSHRGRRWRHQRLRGSTRPSAIARMSREQPTTPFDIVTRPKHAPTPEARAVLASVGINSPEPPAPPDRP